MQEREWLAVPSAAAESCKMKITGMGSSEVQVLDHLDTVSLE